MATRPSKAKKPSKRRRTPPPRARAEETAAATETGDASAIPAPELVVAGVGASAGGLNAFSNLLQSLPPDPGLAIVLVQHLAPQHDSALAVLLSGRTNLPVVQAVEGMR